MSSSQINGGINKGRKLGLFKYIMLGLLILFIVLIIIIVSGVIKSNKGEKQLWSELQAGDSLFISTTECIPGTYVVGHRGLKTYELQEAKYRRNDTIDLGMGFSLDRKYFYINRTSFVGTVISKDTLLIMGKEEYMVSINFSKSIKDQADVSGYDMSVVSFLTDVNSDRYMYLTCLTNINSDYLFK